MIVSIEDEAAEAAEVANLMARRNSQVHIVSFLWSSLQLEAGCLNAYPRTNTTIFYLIWILIFFWFLPNYVVS